MPEQPEAGMSWTLSGRRFWTRLQGRWQDRVSQGTADSHPRAGGPLDDQAAEEEGLWQYPLCSHRKSLRQNESSLNL